MNLDDVLQEIRRLSINGVAPSRDRYDQQRAPGVVSSRQIYRRWGLTWADVVQQAGLTGALGRRVAADTPLDVEEEIRRLLPANRRLERDALDVGLVVLEHTRRVVERRVVQADGSILLLRRESYSLR